MDSALTLALISQVMVYNYTYRSGIVARARGIYVLATYHVSQRRGNNQSSQEMADPSKFLSRDKHSVSI